MTPEEVDRLNRSRRTAVTSFALLGALIATVAVAIGIVFYQQVEVDSKRKEGRIVRPTVDEESVEEIGYINAVRRETIFREHRREVMWWVKVPSTNRTYSCSWESGYSGFSKDDGVRIIHKKEGIDTVDYSGFIVGLHDRQRGRSTAVWAIDVDDIDIDLEPDDSL